MLKLIEENINYVNDITTIRRDYYNDLLENMVGIRGIFVLIGQRRVGKSYVILDFLKNKSNFFYFNKEFDDTNKIKSNLQLSELFEIYEEKYGEAEYVVIDEIQDIQGWEKFIRKIFTYKKYKIIITGSNSNLLSGELATYLTGRFVEIEIYPLIFDEYKFFSQSLNKNISDKQLFLEYVEFGGLPEIVFIDNKYKSNYIKSVKDSIILKDIVSRYGVKNISVLEKILKYLSDVLGSLVSTSNITNYFSTNYDKSISTSIVSKYLEYSKNAFLINETQRYKLKGKKILEYVGKYYFSDIGIRNIFGYNFNFDIGKILENIVYINLKMKGWTVNIGTLKDKEIDFVAEKNGKIMYIQVVYLMIDEITTQREYGNLLEIDDNWPKYVVSMDETNQAIYKGIKHINILEINSIL